MDTTEPLNNNNFKVDPAHRVAAMCGMEVMGLGCVSRELETSRGYWVLHREPIKTGE